MKGIKIWANFRVMDIMRTHQFYSDLGFTSNNINNYPGLASFLFGEDDFIIHFFEQGTQIDKYLTPGTRSANEIVFTLSAQTEAEVKKWGDKVKKAGGTIFQEAGRDENGYFGLGFADPDGHRFNILLLEKGM